MNLINEAKKLFPYGSAYLPAQSVSRLRKCSNLTLDKLMLRLISLAKTYSQSPLSEFPVGAVGLGNSGALYLGANFEFAGCTLNQSVHAEQAVVINAISHQEKGLKKLAVSAPPCGYCRQFLYELVSAQDLIILLKDQPIRTLNYYLPGAFGPENLGVEGGLMDSPKLSLKWTSQKPTSKVIAKSLLVNAALSYSPYTKTPATVCLKTASGFTVTAPYIENAAFNPSISPLLAGLVLLGLAGYPAEVITGIDIAQREESSVNHAASTREILARIGLRVPVHEYLFKPHVADKKDPEMAKQSADRSFYFFDFDDNIMFLKTPILLRNRLTGETKRVSTSKFATIRNALGQPGDWADYEMFEDTYCQFRDIPADKLRKNKQQYFVSDIIREIKRKTTAWQAPSWKLFQYACEKQRPLAMVTARGHSPETIKAGIHELYKANLIKNEPNWLAIYSVGNDEVRSALFESLEDEDERRHLQGLKKKKVDSTSFYKRIAIRQAVENGLEKYGAEPEHRFGMSDDDPENVDLIVKAMCDCKQKHLDKRFFVINTHKGEWVKLEVFPVDYPVTNHARRDRYIT